MFDKKLHIEIINKKKGFTLIELLAVIVILAIIALIATPIILGVIDSVNKSAVEAGAMGYVDAVEKASLLAMVDNETFSGEYQISEISSKVKVKGKTPTKGSVTITSTGIVVMATLCIDDKKVNYDGTKAKISNENCENMTTNKYKDSILNGADPILGSNMIPVTISNSGTVTYANISTKWYDYGNKLWANAVILSSGKYEVGDTIPESAIESYFVYIPRYRYKIFDIGNYTTFLSSKPASTNKKTIDIVFESKDTAASTGSTVDTYLTHPAFTTLNVNGIWVGKFETGYKGATSVSSSNVTSMDPTKIIIKPNVFAWRNNTVYNMFVSSYNYKRTNDSHMMKNTEWGAVAYLSHSNYGTNKEVNINNNSLFKTGCSAKQEYVNIIPFGGTGDLSTFNEKYNTSTGYLASTTGNISGIYDMSGGAWEYMASYINNEFGLSGFTSENISYYNSKYFDIYTSSPLSYSFNNRILGDATGELGPFYNYVLTDSTTRYLNNWYDDVSAFLKNSNSQWFARGANHTYGLLAGLFAFGGGMGGVHTNFGSRIVLAN